MTAQLGTHEDLVLTYQVIPLKRVEQFKHVGLMYTGYLGVATIINGRMVKAKQAWKVLQGKLISLGWRDRGIRIDIF